MSNKEEFKITTGLLLIYVILSVSVGFIAGITAVQAVRPYENNITQNNITPDFSFWSRNNAMEFCNAHGYSGTWMACSIDAGFTCSDSGTDSKGSFLRTVCFSIQDLYYWQYGR